MTTPTQHEVLIGYALEKFDAMVEIVGSLDDQTANGRLAVSGSNSPYALLTHVMGVTRRWASTVNRGIEVPRDRDAEFRACGSVTELIAEAVRQREAFIDDVTETDLDAAPAAPPPDPPAFHLVDCRAVLVHVIEELAQHLGQLEITRDLLMASSCCDRGRFGDSA